MGVVLAGKGKMLAAMIESCVSNGIKISGVLRYETVNSPFFKRLFGEIFMNFPDKILVDKYKLLDIKVKSINSTQFKDFLIKNNVGILIVGTWGEKISEDIINTPVIASVNIHPSLLPKYRGPNPYIEVILNGEKETGVTIHLLDKNYDSGCILAQEKIQISNTDTSDDLRNKVIYKAKEILPKLLNEMEEGLVIPVKQNEAEATYYPLKKFDNIIDFTSLTSSEIIRLVKALHPWIPCYIKAKWGMYLRINPYKIAIKDYVGDEFAGQLLQDYSFKDRLTIVCADGVPLEMCSLKLYPKFLAPLSKIVDMRMFVKY